MGFTQFAGALRREGSPKPFQGNLLALDPGHTTGYAIFKGLRLVDFGQIDSSSVGGTFDRVLGLCKRYKIDAVVYEDYRVYRWRKDHHVGSELHTTRVIGAIESACYVESIPFTKRAAHIAKGFCTDERLQEWGLYHEGLKHANDAIRHGCYHILFGTSGSARPEKRKAHNVG